MQGQISKKQDSPQGCVFHLFPTISRVSETSQVVKECVWGYAYLWLRTLLKADRGGTNIRSQVTNILNHCANSSRSICQMHRWAFCCSVVQSDSLRPHGLQHAGLPCPSLSPRVCSDSCPLNQWCSLTISFSAALFSFAFNLSQHQSLFQCVSCSHQVAKMLELQLQHQSFQRIFRVDFL